MILPACQPALPCLGYDHIASLPLSPLRFLAAAASNLRRLLGSRKHLPTAERQPSISLDTAQLKDSYADKQTGVCSAPWCSAVHYRGIG